MYKSNIKRVQKCPKTRKKATYDQKSKRKFRDSKVWKDFRHQMYEQSGRVCAVTGAKLSRMWQLHHMDLNSDNYENLDPDNFACLSWNMHKVVHAVFVASRPKEWRKRVLNLIRIWKHMEKLLEKK